MWLLLVGSPAAMAQGSPRIVNGTLTSSFASTGAVLIYDDAAQTQLNGLCSGTLVGCRTFVTAAHCVCSNADDAATCLRAGLLPAGRLRVFLQLAGFAQVATVTINPDFVFGEAGDIAVLQLAQPIAGIEASAINILDKPAVGTVGTIVGFGRTINAVMRLSDAGIKREGKVTVADCNGVVPAAPHVCWQFLGSGSSTCSGDSGGPLFIDGGHGAVLAGVTSGGVNDTCEAPDRAFDTDVSVYADWVAEQIHACTTPTDAELFTLLSTDGELSRDSPEARFAVTPPAGTTALRFALNGELSGTDFDLYVRAGGRPSTTIYDCADIATYSFGACDIAAAGTDTWHVLVRRAIGSGPFQLNVTAVVVSTPQICTGDCDADGTVTVEELVVGVNVALGHDAVASCATLDANGDRAVTVDELVGAVGQALRGCSR